MSTYVMGDIHGEYYKFVDLLSKISLQEKDTLYVLGDVLDRGRHPIKVLEMMMQMPNVKLLAGNHEFMAIEFFDFFCEDITKKKITDFSDEMVENLSDWLENGARPTLEEFMRLSERQRNAVTDYIIDVSAYKKIKVLNRKYLLVHAGLGNFSKDKKLTDYSLQELIWDRADYTTKYFDDTLVVTGHTPTQLIEGNDRPGFIFRKNNHIAIDCGACYQGGRLAAICLETGEEFYSEERH